MKRAGPTMVSLVCQECWAPYERAKSQVDFHGSAFCSKLCAVVHLGKKSRLSVAEMKRKLRGGRTLLECWPWPGVPESNGYARTTFQGVRKWSVHRLSWHLFRGAIPDGSIVCHKCDTPNCTNPRHLFIGTQKDNIADMIRKGRAAWQREDRCAA